MHSRQTSRAGSLLGRPCISVHECVCVPACIQACVHAFVSMLAGGMKHTPHHHRPSDVKFNKALEPSVGAAAAAGSHKTRAKVNKRKRKIMSLPTPLTVSHLALPTSLPLGRAPSGRARRAGGCKSQAQGRWPAPPPLLGRHAAAAARHRQQGCRRRCLALLLLLLPPLPCRRRTAPGAAAG